MYLGNSPLVVFSIFSNSIDYFDFLVFFLLLLARFNSEYTFPAPETPSQHPHSQVDDLLISPAYQLRITFVNTWCISISPTPSP